MNYMKLELRGLTKNYNDIVAVNDVNISLTQGVWGLMGANGAGKTTLIRMMVGNLKPTSGHILYNGNEIFSKSNDDLAYKNILGYLPQEFGCSNSFKVLSFLEYIAALKGISKKTYNDRVYEILDYLNLTKYKNKKINQLSGGTKRRVGIAQALLNNPKILILDEPTSGLDPEERIKLRNILSDLSKDKIILVSTHIIPDIEAMAQYSILYKGGQIIESGNTFDIITMVRGLVWSQEFSSKEFETIKSKINIVNTKISNNGNINVRYISDTRISEESRKEKETLEDAYVYFSNRVNFI